VALTGYETITVFKSDFNITQSHWYDHWLPGAIAKPGTLCDPHIFNVGDTFTTNYQLFQWTIESISNANAGDSGIVYKGTTLEDCDISTLDLNGDIRTRTLDITAVVTCSVNGEFEVRARTSFTMTSLPGNYSPVMGASGSNNSTSQAKVRSLVLDMM
jgi:hypothetical protein